MGFGPAGPSEDPLTYGPQRTPPDLTPSRLGPLPGAALHALELDGGPVGGGVPIGEPVPVVLPAPRHVLGERGEGPKSASGVHLGGFFAARRNDRAGRRLSPGASGPRIRGGSFLTVPRGTLEPDRLLAGERSSKRHPCVRCRRGTQGIQVARGSYQDGGLHGHAPVTAIYSFDVLDTSDGPLDADRDRHMSQ